MIILIVALFIILTFISWFFIKPTIIRWIAGILSLILLAGSLLILTGNFAWHWGMKEVKSTQTQPIYTAGQTTAAYNLLIKHQIGTNSGNYVFVYRTSKDQKSASQHFVPNEDKIIESVKKTATYKQNSSIQQAQIKTITTKRVFASHLSKLLFAIGGGNKELIHQETRVQIPQDTWLVLTDTQAKTLQKKAPQLEKVAQAKEAAAKDQFEAQLQAQMEQAKAQTAAAIAANPAAAAQIQAAAQKEMAQKEAAAKAQFEEQLKAKLDDPATQIAAIKNILGIK